jgi:hypothetical protein
MSWKTLPRSDPSPGCKDAVIGARLDDELYGLLRSQEACDVHRSILIETFFRRSLRWHREEVFRVL